MRSVPTIAFACLAVLSGAAPADASTATPVNGMFSITPARRYVVARPPVELAASTVANGTQAALEVEAIPVLLSQSPSGAFAFSDEAAQVREAGSILGIAPRRFRLAPGGSREVSLRWRRLPAHVRAANLGVVYQAVPLSGGGAVHVVEQLLSVDLLRLPGRYRISGAISAMHVGEPNRGSLSIGIDAENTGNAFATPRSVELSVYDSANRRVVHRSIAPDVVLPGDEREFALELEHRLRAGRYRAVARMRFGRSRARRSISFRLVAGGRLPAPNVELGPLSASGSAGGQATVSAAIHNAGTAAGGTKVKLALYRLRDGEPSGSPLATRTLAVVALRSGESKHVHAQLGKLDSGTYRLVGSYTDAGGAPQKLVADFDAAAGPSVLARLASFSREHALLIPAGLLTLIAVLLALALLRVRSVRRELATVRASAVSAPRAAAGGGGLAHGGAMLALCLLALAVLGGASVRRR
jgi:hypothetical protein